MIEETRRLAEKWLESGKVDGIVGLRENDGYVAPYLFTETGELESLVVSSQIRRTFCTSKSQRFKKNVLYLLQQKYPKAKIGVVARGCEEKAIIELAKRNQLDLERITILAVACTREEAIDCRCPTPYPTRIDVGKRVEGVSSDVDVEALQKKSLQERFSFWKHELSKCIKCYGCRNVCPSCFCEDCKMELELWAKMGQLPPEIPMFHFIRWYHVADRCIECGACEKACPVDIPLLTILKLLRRDIKEMFDYEAGLDAKQEAPLLTTLDETPLKE
ncbi:hypothetical protein A3K79_04965 [Candidatus Bathyarchaeota archaeon RBG_13_46_16b]|nr:MAG: hypothetical protein A3K79_04965 [Candidatus Bathyarchaeota archaeon RBG_13_46_16b]